MSVLPTSAYRAKNTYFAKSADQVPSAFFEELPSSFTRLLFGGLPKGTYYVSCQISSNPKNQSNYNNTNTLAISIIDPANVTNEKPAVYDTLPLSSAKYIPFLTNFTPNTYTISGLVTVIGSTIQLNCFAVQPLVGAYLFSTSATAIRLSESIF